MGIFDLAGFVVLGSWTRFWGVLGSGVGFLAVVAMIHGSVGFGVCNVSGSGAILYGGLMTWLNDQNIPLL